MFSFWDENKHCRDVDEKTDKILATSSSLLVRSQSTRDCYTVYVIHVGLYIGSGGTATQLSDIDCNALVQVRVSMATAAAAAATR